MDSVLVFLETFKWTLEHLNEEKKSGYILYGNDKLNAGVGFNVSHALFIEFGTGDLVDVLVSLEDFAIQFIGNALKK